MRCWHWELDEQVVSIRPDRWQKWLAPVRVSDANASAGGDWGVKQIRADQVWSAFGVNGEGVVAAIMDTGVDWQHPALLPAYRGSQGGVPIHTSSWFDATGGGALYPVDSMGHGTHVMGLLAGQEGVGVAPGAQWIAVRAFDNFGYALDSWLHAGFQWLMAPAGNPQLAPDLVSNSWSNPVGGTAEFRPDVQALVAAGIVPLFAAGNYGPDPGSIGAPASYLEGLAVGASDIDDGVVGFSGRGPSPFGGVKPDIVAPGVNLRSTLPGGAYGENSGTSMATPLAAGVAALLMQAAPSLSVEQVMQVITSTTAPVGDPWPNPDAGWGRVDAFSAVASVLQPGYLEGQVSGLGVGPLAGATVRATRHGAGATTATQTDTDGDWALALLPGLYDIEATYFAYSPAAVTGLSVITGTVTRQDLFLSPLPTGRVEGTVSAGGEPLPATIHVVSTPVTTTASLTGSYALALPSGHYTLTAEHWGYRVGQDQVTVTVGGAAVRDFELPKTPTLLLVDSGAWYYGSEIDYFRAALEDQRYLYHDWRVKTPLRDTPTVTDLLPYDAVVWSSPADSPGFIQAGAVISDYLTAGGNLLISGQNVGFWDSGANGYIWAPYYTEKLRAVFLAHDAGSSTLIGRAGGPLEGLTLTLNGPGGARNQFSPDSVAPLDLETANPLLDYSSSGNGGVAAERCLGHRAFYLSFGLEGVGERTDRAEVMGRALSWFVSPLPTVGVSLQGTADTLIAPAGSVVTHTVVLRNTGEAGAGDRYSLTLTGAEWPTTILTSSLFLSPCQMVEIPIRVDVPITAGQDETDQSLLIARSAVSPSLTAAVTLTTKTPAPILLVDDDRWFDQEQVYEAALEAGGYRFDRWDTGWRTWQRPGAPPTDTLALYPLVLWFTGYDWYAPVTDAEAQRIETYLSGGGRLFLSSQDALYYQDGSPLAERYLGVLSYGEDVTPTMAIPTPDALSGRLGGRFALPESLSLGYSFPNLSDGLIPAADAAVELFSDVGWAVGLTHAGADWKTAFFSFPFEALPAAEQPRVMEQVVGWLGWLGSSDFRASVDVAPAGGVVTFTASLRNDGPRAATTVFTNPWPAALQLVPGTLEGASYDGDALRWQGALDPGEVHTVRYAASVTGSVTNTVLLAYDEHEITTRRSVAVWVEAPDLRPSRLSTEAAVVLPGRPVTFSLSIRNSGLADAVGATAAWTLPACVTVLTDTLQATGGAAILTGRLVDWSGDVTAGDTVTVSLVVLTLPGLEQEWLSSGAVLDDNVTVVVVRGHVLELRPARIYLPIVLR